MFMLKLSKRIRNTHRNTMSALSLKMWARKQASEMSVAERALAKHYDAHTLVSRGELSTPLLAHFWLAERGLAPSAS